MLSRTPLARHAPDRTGSGLSQSRPAARLPAFVLAVATLGVTPCLAAPREIAVAGLDAAVQASWTQVPLGDWAERASRIAGLPVIIDRRLDPAFPITLDCRGEPLHDVLDRVAAMVGGQVEVLASSVRIGPLSVAGLASAAEQARDAELASLPPALRRTAHQRAAWTWPTAARPRDLLATTAREAGLELDGLDAIPHDHLPAATLPMLSLAERLDLVLAHYDRRIAWTAGGAEVVPLDAGMTARDHAPRPAAASQLEPQPNPKAQATSQPQRKPTPRPLANPTTTRETFSLRLAAPLDQALAAVAARLSLDLTIDAPSLAARGIAPGEIARVDVREVSRAELLDAIVAPFGLAWSINAGTLRVFASAAAAGREEP